MASKKETTPLPAHYPVAKNHAITVGMGRSNGKPMVAISFLFGDQKNTMLVSSDIGRAFGSCLLGMAEAIAKMEGGAA